MPIIQQKVAPDSIVYSDCWRGYHVLANRRANLFIGTIQIMSVIGVNRAPDLDDLFFAVIELIALLLIIRLAWDWKEPATEQV